MTYIFIASCIALFIVPGVLIYHDVYDDGVVGRFALGGISFWSGTILLEQVFEAGWDVHAEIAFLALSVAIFFVWHLYRFQMRLKIAQKAREGKIDRRRLLT